LYRKQPAHDGRALTISLGPVNQAATICCEVVWGVTFLLFSAEPTIMAHFGAAQALRLSFFVHYPQKSAFVNDQIANT